MINRKIEIMKLLKYILIAIVFAATAGEAFGQVKVLSGKVTEMFGATAEPMVGVLSQIWTVSTT